MILQDKFVAGLFAVLLCISLICYGTIAIGKVFGSSMTIWPLWYLGFASGFALIAMAVIYLLLSLIKPRQ